jgi:hypothetical protein
MPSASLDGSWPIASTPGRNSNSTAVEQGIEWIDFRLVIPKASFCDHSEYQAARPRTKPQMPERH